MLRAFPSDSASEFLRAVGLPPSSAVVRLEGVIALLAGPAPCAGDERPFAFVCAGLAPAAHDAIDHLLLARNRRILPYQSKFGEGKWGLRHQKATRCF